MMKGCGVKFERVRYLTNTTPHMSLLTKFSLTWKFVSLFSACNFGEVLERVVGVSKSLIF